MPKLSKSFHLEITVEQFLNACSLLELQEVDLRLDSYLKKAQAEHDRQERLAQHTQDQIASSLVKAIASGKTSEDLDFDEDF